ncbi:hypothetical protein CHS0354_032992, partial [Potamilus streckersoni]
MGSAPHYLTLGVLEFLTSLLGHWSPPHYSEHVSEESQTIKLQSLRGGKEAQKEGSIINTTANNPQLGTSTEGASMEPHLINVITQEVSDMLTTQMTREINNKFDQI